MALQGATMGGAMAGGMMAVPTLSGGNAMATSANFSFGNAMPQAAKAASASGAGGAYDLRGMNRPSVDNPDDGPCLGIDIGDGSCGAFVLLEGEAVSVTGKDTGKDTPGKDTGGGKDTRRLPTVVYVDPKSGVRGLRRWLGKVGRAAALPKGISVGEVPNPPTAGDDKGSDGNGSGQAIGGLVRLLGLRQRSGEMAAAERLARAEELKLPSAATPEMDDTSALQVRVVSPLAKEEKDRELFCLAEDLLAVVIVALKLKAEEKLQTQKVRCCVAMVPATFTGQQRVSLQRAIFTAGLTPRRFIAAPLAATVAAAATAAKSKGKGPGQDSATIVAVDVGASHTDVCLIKTGLTRAASAGNGNDSGGASNSGGGGGGGVGSFVVAACAGDSFAGGRDIDIRLVQANAGNAADMTAANWHSSIAAAQKAREGLTGGGGSGTTISRAEAEAAAAPLRDILKEALAAVLRQSGTSAGAVSQVVVCGGCTAAPKLFDVLIEALPNATVVRPEATAAARGACLAMAAETGYLPQPFRAVDALPAEVAISTASGSVPPDVLFATNAALPARCTRAFSKSDSKRAASKNLQIVQRVLQGVSGDGGGGGNWATVSAVGDPLLAYDNRDNPIIANSTVLEFTVDGCGLVSYQVVEEDLPDLASRDRMWTWLNRLAAVAAVATTLWAGYRQLNAMAMAPQLQAEDARIRLHKFYTLINPEKLDSIEATIEKYNGRYDTLFKRLEDKYGMKV